MNSSFLRWEKVKNWIYKNRSNKITIVVWPQNVSLLNFCPFVCWTILINQIISLILKIFIWIWVWTWSRVYFEGSIYFWKVKIEPEFTFNPKGLYFEPIPVSWSVKCVMNTIEDPMEYLIIEHRIFPMLIIPRYLYFLSILAIQKCMFRGVCFNESFCSGLWLRFFCPSLLSYVRNSLLHFINRPLREESTSWYWHITKSDSKNL